MEEEIDKDGKMAKKGSYETSVKKASETSSSEDLSSLESEEETPVPSNTWRPSSKVVKRHNNNDGNDSSEESTDNYFQEAVRLYLEKSPNPSNMGKRSSKVVKSDNNSDGDDSSEESTDDFFQPGVPLYHIEETDVKMRDAPSTNANKKASSISDKDEPKTPAPYQIQTSGSKTLFVGNLSFKVIRDEVEKFFKKAGKITRVDLNEYCHVEFATEEAAQKALALKGKKLLGRAVRLKLARERALNIPERGRENSSFQKGGTSQGQTIYIKGFDKTLSEDQIRSSLKEHFDSCGEVSRLSVPTYSYSGAPMGFAFMDFKDQDGFSKALEFNGSDLGDYSLKVDKAYPQNERRGRAWSSGGAGVGDGRGSRDGWDGGGGFSGRLGGGGGWEEHGASYTKNWTDGATPPSGKRLSCCCCCCCCRRDGGGSRDGWDGGGGFSDRLGGGGGWKEHGASYTKNWGDGGGSRDGWDGGGGFSDRRGGGGGWKEHGASYTKNWGDGGGSRDGWDGGGGFSDRPGGGGGWKEHGASYMKNWGDGGGSRDGWDGGGGFSGRPGADGGWEEH